jgi:hypothetical protein
MATLPMAYILLGLQSVVIHQISMVVNIQDSQSCNNKALHTISSRVTSHLPNSHPILGLFRFKSRVASVTEDPKGVHFDGPLSWM